MAGKRLPQIGRIELSIIEPPQPQLLAFASGALDILDLPFELAPKVLDASGRLLPAYAAQGIDVQRVTDRMLATTTLRAFETPSSTSYIARASVSALMASECTCTSACLGLSEREILGGCGCMRSGPPLRARGCMDTDAIRTFCRSGVSSTSTQPHRNPSLRASGNGAMPGFAFPLRRSIRRPAFRGRRAASCRCR
jgi:hypothetical protein